MESFGCEALTLFVLQWCHIRQLQGTEDKQEIFVKASTSQKMMSCDFQFRTNLDFSTWVSFFVVTCFLVLGLIEKFEVSSFTFAEATVLPFFFTGS